MTRIKRIKWTRSLCITAVLAALLSLSGCWSAKEVNDLATINLIGIDQNEAGQVELTAVITKPYTLFSQTAVAGRKRSKFQIETVTGESVFEALSDLSSSISETLYFGHVDAIIFGEKAARERMMSVLDFFKRQNDFRPNINILITRGSASKLVQTTPQQNITLGLELRDLVIRNRFAPTAMVKDISQFIESFYSDTTDTYTGVISPAQKQGVDILEPKKGAKTQSNTKNNKGKTSGNTAKSSKQKVPKALSLKGTAVFKGGKLKGFLNEKETRGFLWIRGELKNEIVVLPCGPNNNRTVSLDIRDSDSQLTPQLAGASLQMDVAIQAEADIGQITCKDTKMSTALLERLNHQLEEKIRTEAIMALNKAKNQWQTDIFGFGRSIYQNHPNEWKQMASIWRNGLLKEMEVDFTITTNISRYGLLKDPPSANK